MPDERQVPPIKSPTPSLEPLVQQNIDQAMTAAKGPNPSAFFNNFLVKLPVLEEGKITSRYVLEDTDADVTYRTAYRIPNDEAASDYGSSNNEFPKNYSPAFLDSTPKQFVQAMVQAIADVGMTVEELQVMRAGADHEFDQRTLSSDQSQAARDYFERIALIYAELLKKGFNRKDLYT